MERANPSLLTQGLVSDELCLMTVNSGSYMTVAMADITTRWPERQLNEHDTLQMVSSAQNEAQIEDERNAYQILVTKPEGKRPLERPRHKWVVKGKVVPVLN
jgi:hypothetical protein